MYYVTFKKQNNQTTQYTLDMLYAGLCPDESSNRSQYHTIRKDNIDSFIEYIQRSGLYNSLTQLLEDTTELDKTYSVYRIPKASGGYREISEPNTTLKELQKSIYTLLANIGTHPHDDVYSYVAERSCKDALLKHQQTNTVWFYKFDIKDFFPSCTAEVLAESLKAKVFPFCILTEKQWNRLLDIALYNGSLPQGSPLSPLLSNMVLTPFDFHMHYSIKHFNGVYTRYADDILISLPEKKELSFIENIINNHLRIHVSKDLKLKSEKSRCGSIAGANWNLGLMLNKDRNITLGHAKKMRLKAKINNFIYDFTNQNFWSIIDTQVLQGEVNYFLNIEPEYAAFVIQRLEQKHNTALTLSAMFVSIINGSVG
jgi:hypothetical protein